MATRVPAVAGKVINIGRAGENLATIVEFDVADWIKPINEGGFGTSGTFSLYVQQGGGGYYPQNLVQRSAAELTNNIVEWEVTNSNTAIVGLGKCELVYAISGENDSSTIVKSIIYDIVVTNSLDIEAQGSVPSAIESWINEVSQMTADISNAANWAVGPTAGGQPNANPTDENNAKFWAEQANDAASRVEGLTAGTTTTLAPGSNATVTKQEVAASGNIPAHYEFDFGIPRGAVFWKSSASYSSPNYTFTISNLIGPSDTTPMVGDIILYSYYYFVISSVGTTTVLAGQLTTIRGATGSAATITIGNVTTGNAGTNASVSNSGTSSAAVFNFTIPKGEKGEKGDKGDGFANILTSLPTANASNYNTYKDKVWIYNGHAYSITQSGSSYSWIDGGAIGGITAKRYNWASS